MCAGLRRRDLPRSDKCLEFVDYQACDALENRFYNWPYEDCREWASYGEESLDADVCASVIA